MSHRVVKGLKWARLDDVGPGFSASRARGAKRAGLKYEKDLAKAFGPKAAHGRWIKFEDQNGIGFAQPDILYPNGKELFIVESKYTWVPEAHTQIALLYQPLLECIYADAKIFGIVACKVLTQFGAAKRVVCSDMDQAMNFARGGEVPILHWIGTGPLWPGRLRGLLSPAALGL